jgi:hypothetical protein
VIPKEALAFLGASLNNAVPGAVPSSKKGASSAQHAAANIYNQQANNANNQQNNVNAANQARLLAILGRDVGTMLQNLGVVNYNGTGNTNSGGIGGGMSGGGVFQSSLDVVSLVDTQWIAALKKSNKKIPPNYLNFGETAHDFARNNLTIGALLLRGLMRAMQGNLPTICHGDLQLVFKGFRKGDIL